MNQRTARTRRSSPTLQLESGFRCPGDELQLHSLARKILITWSLPWGLRRIRTSLGSTVVLTAGSVSQLPAAVIVPGAGLSAATLQAAVTEIARTRRVFVVDIPGEPGMSAARRPASADLDQYGRWLDEVLAALGESAVVLIGHALGAAIVLSSTPHTRVAGTLLVNPERLSTSRWCSWSAVRRFLWRRSTDIGAAQHYLTHITGDRFIPSDTLVTWFCNVGAYCHPTPTRPHVIDDRIAIWTSHAPMIVAAGTEDPLAPRWTVNKSLRQHRVSMIELEGTGHLAPVEDPLTLAQILQRQEYSSRRPGYDS